MPRRVRMPAADELFRTTAGNGTLMHNGRGEEATERPPARERGGHNGAGNNGGGHPGGSHDAAGSSTPGTPNGAGLKGPSKTVPAPAVSAEQAAATVQASAAPAPAAPAPSQPPAAASTAPEQAQPVRKATAPRRPSGRERHDEKITVYVSPDELLGLEHARITLRGEYGVAVDRGRIVREAVAALLADLDARGRDSILVKRLSSGG